MNLGKILAIALPIIAGGASYMGGGQGTTSGKESSVKNNFLSDAANAFLGASGLRAEERPFAQSATPRQNRPTAALTRGDPTATVASAGQAATTTFESPLYRSALEGLLARGRNKDVQQLLAMYAQPVTPTKTVNRANTNVRLTEISGVGTRL